VKKVSKDFIVEPYTCVEDQNRKKLRHPLAQRFHDILSEIGRLHDKKQKDYGKEDDPFANVRSAEEWGIPGWVYCMLRIGEKGHRLQAMRRNGKLANESATDSFRDLAVYALIAEVLFEEAQRKLAPSTIGNYCDFQNFSDFARDKELKRVRSHRSSKKAARRRT